jgi:hypothetical protein
MARKCECCKERLSLHGKRGRYCSKAQCQRERKREWQRKKLAEDAAYRGNQADAQKRWRLKHPEYMRNYRACHPEYVERNRELQKQRRKRDHAQNALASGAGSVVKMDAADLQVPVIAGIYELHLVDDRGVVKMDSVRVQLSILDDVT